MKLGIPEKLNSLEGLRALHPERVNPMMLLTSGLVLLLLLFWMLFNGKGGSGSDSATFRQVEQSLGQVSDMVRGYRRALLDQQVQDLATLTFTELEQPDKLQRYLSGRIQGLQGIELYDINLEGLNGAKMGPYGFATLDLLYSALETGLGPLQLHGGTEDRYLAIAVRIGEAQAPLGLLMVKIDPVQVIAAFNASLTSPGGLALVQYNGRFARLNLVRLAEPPEKYGGINWLQVPGSLLHVGVKQHASNWNSGGILQASMFIAGLLLTGLGLLFKFRPFKPRQEDPETKPPRLLTGPALAGEESEGQQSAPPETIALSSTMDGGEATDDHAGSNELDNLGFNLEKQRMAVIKDQPPVELVESIFRAYDIRGVVGETLDAEVARQVGQVIGSLTLEAQAAPAIVARDGRDSGPALVEGMIAGIASTGCDVIDIGAVPTGVLYFAAYELGNGTGVMITGSHNPPEYNGIKMVIGGVTQSGDQITDMYTRIKSGNLRVGKGDVSQQEVLGRYREKIAGDIRLARPLKVVADCGNGIGGVCAANVLRDIGAEVYPLFDEVDGNFPNHHPDPSEPENLEDLIESVRLMDADLGVAFDGDADRLGVVTSLGDIIYSDRLMMLFVKDVLSRVPGGTIIYDVKCTGHLHEVIEDAGGTAMMYKTGHSLIKNKMKEVDAPFAGEMSGHFFFKERWYGFDCGIYSAARLLEILAADDRDPLEILNSLPDSVSTPEIKVQTSEGQNHTFVAEMQRKANFPGAKINTIDGVRADFADGWGLVRASNTTPVLVLRFDADNEEALARIMDDFKQQMLAINDQLQLPF